MNNDWLWAGIAVVAGIVLGISAGRIVRRVVSGRRYPAAIRSAAPALGSLAFSAFLVAGLMTGLGFVKRDALEQIPEDLVDYLPKAISAAIVLILGNIVATLVQTAAAGVAGRSEGAAASQIPTVARGTVMGFAIILAAAQLGIDTTVINIAVAALLFSLGLALALLVGFGGRTVSSEIAAGRALRRIVQEGDRITTDAVEGTVLSVHSVAVELLKDGETDTTLVPNSDMISSSITLRRLEPPEE